MNKKIILLTLLTPLILILFSIQVESAGCCETTWACYYRTSLNRCPISTLPFYINGICQGTDCCMPEPQYCGVNNCCSGLTCKDSTCCSDGCSSYGVRQCTGPSTYEQCVYSPVAPCLDWSSFTCPSGGQCWGEGYCCTNECTLGDRQCPVTGGTTFKQCVSDYDEDPCSEWETFSCPSGQICVNGQCVCIPTTCSALGKTCGSWSDGCGGTLNCGTCSTGYTCTNGQCVCTDTIWTDTSPCSGCIPTCSSSCPGTKTQKSNCGNTRTVSCTIPATTCSSGQICQSDTGACKTCTQATDFNTDGYIGLLDKKIFDYCYGEKKTSSSYTLNGRTYSCSGSDINKDGKIDFSDFILFSSCSASPPPCTKCVNLNRDCVVDFSDFILFSSCYENYYGAYTFGGINYPSCSEADFDNDMQVIGTQDDPSSYGGDYQCLRSKYGTTASCNSDTCKAEGESCTLDLQCPLNYYCTTNTPADRRCCADGYKWDSDFNRCVDNEPCSPGVFNCISQNIGHIIDCITGGLTCCDTQFGSVTEKDWIPKADCIIPY